MEKQIKRGKFFGFVEIPERTKTPERTCIYRNALLILFFPLLMCGFMTLLLFVCHLYAIKFKWILIQRKLNSDMFGISVFWCNRPEFPPSQFFPRGKTGPHHSFPGEKTD